MTDEERFEAATQLSKRLVTFTEMGRARALYSLLSWLSEDKQLAIKFAFDMTPGTDVGTDVNYQESLEERVTHLELKAEAQSSQIDSLWSAINELSSYHN
jgi:hypothetical protein